MVGKLWAFSNVLRPSWSWMCSGYILVISGVSVYNILRDKSVIVVIIDIGIIYNRNMSISLSITEICPLASNNFLCFRWQKNHFYN